MADKIEEARFALERVQNFDVDLLPRKDILGSTLSFEAAVEPATRIIRLFQQIPLDHLKDLTSDHLTILTDQSNSFYKMLTNVLGFSPEKIDSPAQTRIQYINEITTTYNQLFNVVHPLVSYLSSRQRDFAALEREARAAVQAATDQANSLKEMLSKDRDEAQRILEEVRQVAAEQGVSQQAIYFKDESEKHDGEANKWRLYTAITAVILILFAFLSLFLHKWSFIAPNNIYEAIQIGLSKILIFGVIAYMLILCARNFLSHKHNSIVNKHRQNALLTFNALADAARGEDKRDIVLTHAAACIFMPQETGYIRAGGSQDGGAVKLIEIIPKLGGSGTAPS